MATAVEKLQASFLFFFYLVSAVFLGAPSTPKSGSPSLSPAREWSRLSADADRVFFLFLFFAPSARSPPWSEPLLSTVASNKRPPRLAHASRNPSTPSSTSFCLFYSPFLLEPDTAHSSSREAKYRRSLRVMRLIRSRPFFPFL